MESTGDDGAQAPLPPNATATGAEGAGRPAARGVRRSCCVVLLAFLIAVGVLLAVLSRLEAVPNGGMACMHNLKDLAEALRAYRQDHGGHPPQLTAVRPYLNPVYGAPVRTFQCPSLEPTAPGTGYTYRVPSDPARREVVIWDTAPRHKGGANMAFEDGMVLWRHASESDPRRALPSYGTSETRRPDKGSGRTAYDGPRGKEQSE